MLSEPKENTDKQLNQIGKMIHNKRIVSTEIENIRNKTNSKS